MNGVTTKTDNELMAAVRFGERSALGTIFDRHHKQLTQTAFHTIGKAKGKKEIADEAVQDAFVKIIGMMGRDSFWQQDKGSVLGWLKMIVKQQAIQALRKKSASEMTCCDIESDDYQPYSNKADASPQWTGEHFQKLVQSLISILPKQTRLVIQMTLEGYSNKEIACSLGISLATISRHCKLARDMVEDGDFGLAA